MKITTCPQASFLCLLVLMVLNRSTEALFFHYPKRAIMSFLESLGGHKDIKPVHHYHMHYYPVPLVLPQPAPAPKIKIGLSTINHNGGFDQLRSLSWASSSSGSQDLNKLPEPELSVPSIGGWDSPLQAGGWPDDSFQQKSGAWAWDNNDLLEKEHAFKEAKPSGILLQVPLQQQIVFYQPPAKDTKSSLLTILLKKLRRLNDALFHPEQDEHAGQHAEPPSQPHITNSLTYAPAASAH